MHTPAKPAISSLVDNKPFYKKGGIGLDKKAKITLSLVIGSFVVLVATMRLSIFAAGDTSTEWDFSAPGNYNVSDSTLIEVTNSTARFKTRNYADDANTGLLLHLDETSGVTAEDSSSNGTDGTVTSPSWVTGNLNNGLALNGTTSRIAVPDAVSNSPTQSHSLEAWVKFNSNFSSNSHDNRQGIFDKGDYQLYYNNESGKLVYEMANATQTWEQVAGDEVNDTWDETGLDTFGAIASIGTKIYAGLGDTNGDAEVWEYDGTEWTRIGGDTINNSWGIDINEITSMTEDGSTLYVGTGNGGADGEVWAWNGITWTRLGGDGINSGWSTAYDTVESLEFFDGTLYAGLGRGNNEAEVWAWNGTDSWTQVGGDSLNSGWTTNYNVVQTMAADSNYLYVGLGLDSGEAEVWRYDGADWEKVGGDGLSSSWGAGYEYVFTLQIEGTDLYAGLGSSTNDAEIWTTDISGPISWSKIGGDGVSSSWSGDKEAIRDIDVVGSNLYVGLGSGNGDAEVWSTDIDTINWSQIGGDSINSGWTNGATEVERFIVVGGTLYAGVTDTNDDATIWSWNGTDTWTQVGGAGVRKSWGLYGIEYVKALTVYKSELYAATGGGGFGEATVWSYDNSDWTIMGGQSLNGSWDDQEYERINSLVNHSGNLYAALGATGNVDTDVWEYNGTTWEQIGGDGLNDGWNTGYNEVFSLVSHDGNLYAGLGASTGDSEVWEYADSSWNLVGGDNVNSSWNGQDEVSSMISDGTYLYAGLGNDAGEAEVWRYNGSSWTMIGGDGMNSSWADSTFESVQDFAFYKGVLYAGLGRSTDDAEVWSWNGTNTWTQVGGDGTNSSWGSGYEYVETLAVYNGKLVAGLGNSAGDGEVWEYNGSTWNKIGGDDVNDGFDSNKEQIYDLTVYKGKLYAGIGNSGNADAEIWSYGNNAYLESNQTSQDTNWHHIAATYNGATMKIFIDGVLDNSTNVAQFLNDSSIDLLIGTTYGSHKASTRQGNFDGTLDEIRLSDDLARTSFTTSPYATTTETVQPATAAMTSGIKNWEDFNVSQTLNGGTITYRLSSDGGSTWQYYNSGWVTSASTSEANNAATINSNIDTFPAGSGGILWQAIFDGDGTQRVTLNSVEITATADTTAPSNPSLLTALSEAGGNSIDSDTTYSHEAPYFSWTGASDGSGSGVAGYYVYFGTDETADPLTAGSFQANATYTASGLTSGNTYYLRIKSTDNAQNTNAATWAPFNYVYDETPPSPKNVDYISPAGGSFGNISDMNFSWPTTGNAASAPYDGGPDILGWQYAINNTDTWLGSQTAPISGISYIPVGYSQPYNFSAAQDGDYIIVGENTIYFRTLDEDETPSSEATYRTGSITYSGAAPTFATSCNVTTGVTVTPSTSSTNSFSLSWPSATPDDGQFVTNYYYMVNTTPPTTLSTITGNTATYINNGTTRTVSAGTLPGAVKGSNTVYVVAVDDDNNYSGSNCLKGTFTLNSTNPDPPLNLSATDASIKASELWRASLAWEEPEYTGTGNITYKIQVSENGSTWTDVATTTGTAYVDTVDESKQYYWRVGAYDTSSDSINSPSYANAVTLTPKGTFTEAPSISGDPTVTNITTKKATVSWSTSRNADSKIQYGTDSDDYFEEEPSKSEQVTSHEIELTNLSPGTKYYYRTKWTDEDGNTGISDEFEFETDPAPEVIDPQVSSVGIESATVEFTVTGASRAKIYYGESTSFGGTTEISTSTSESTYAVTLTGLTDGTKYFYKINTFDSESDEYEGSTLSFETLPRPRISEVRIQQVRNTAQPTVLITWNTNTAISSIVTYYPEGNPSGAIDEVDVSLISGEHRIIIRGLVPTTAYTLIVSGRDIAGNEASSDPQRFTTSTDTRPPLISNLKIEGSNIPASASGGEQRSQLVVSWDTDEVATSQVEYGEGTGSTYSQSTQEDANLTFNHLVLISGLTPSKVYHLRAISKDETGNITQSIDNVTITPKATDSALDLVISNLQEAFGFIGAFNTQ